LATLQAEWEKVAVGFDFPEGPAWDGEQYLYISNCHGNRISRYHDMQVDTFLTDSNSVIQTTNGLTVYKDGYLYACDYGINAILKISPAGDVQILAGSYQDSSLSRPNDLAFDRNGNLFFTDPKSYGPDRLDGRLFRLPEDGTGLELVRDSLAFPNGIAFSPLDQRLYVCESAKIRILRFTLTTEGTILDEDVFIELPGGDPDGIAFDVQGNLYAAHFGSGTLFVIPPSGEFRHRRTTPGSKPTNLDFGGPGLKTLYLTEVETGGLYRMAVPLSGTPLN
jgi:gluconolactonase